MADAGKIYSASEIIGKSLFALKPVQLKRVPTDSAPAVFTVQPGEQVGKVYSWNDVKLPERSTLYWMFMDGNNKPFYAAHKEGVYNISDIREQGAVSVKEAIEAEKRKNETTKDFIRDILKTAITGAVIWGGVKLITLFSGGTQKK